MRHSRRNESAQQKMLTLEGHQQGVVCVHVYR
jgi:hypothetical protein